LAAQPFFSRTLAGFYLYEPGILIPGGQGAERLLSKLTCKFYIRIMDKIYKINRIKTVKILPKVLLILSKMA
jgi:hypothetical protein